MKILDRLSHAWNAFKDTDYISTQNRVTGPVSSYRPDRPRFSRGNDKSLVTTILNRIAVDCSMVNIEHARVDDNGNYLETIKSGLNNCLVLDANSDQIGKAFIQDVVMSLLDEGSVAIVPTDTTLNPNVTGSYDVEKLRTGKILQWYPNDVQVRVFNEKTGQKEDIIMPKKTVAIIENPFYQVMNEPNSTLRRVVRILNKLDIMNDQNSSGKLDMIIQFPYTLNSPRKIEQAENRRKSIENQLMGSKFGIAYTDGTERITQLNRSLENNLLSQVEYFMKMLYSQLGISETVFNGTATEEEMLNYYDRTINPIMAAIAEEMTRKFLTKTARTQGQAVWYFRDPFDLVPVNKLAEIADTFIRNEILSKNEVRAIIGFKPSDDPSADELHNPQLYPEENQNEGEMVEEGPVDDEDTQNLQSQIDSLDDYDQTLDDMESQLAQSLFMVYDNVLIHSELNLDEVNDKDVYEYLAHYASPYYDPVYAHEYYMKHRKLKGRNKLSEKGKEIADYVTKQLNAERDKKISSSKASTSKNLESAKNSRTAAIESSANVRDKNIQQKKNSTQSAIDNHKAQMGNQIKQLQDELAAWGASGKKGKTKEIRNKIARLREQNNEAKEKLQNDLSSYSSSEREAHTNRSTSAKNEYSDSSSKIRSAGSAEVSKIKEDYENRLASEMGKIMKEYSADSKSGNSALAGKIAKNHAKVKSNISSKKEKK